MITLSSLHADLRSNDARAAPLPPENVRRSSIGASPSGALPSLFDKLPTKTHEKTSPLVAGTKITQMGDAPILDREYRIVVAGRLIGCQRER